MRPMRILVLTAVLCAGCSSAKEEPTAPVEGRIDVASQPLATGRIVFIPDASKGNTSRHEARGKIEAGKFKLSSNGKDGAALGWYQVTVFAMSEPESSTDPTPTKWYANKRYTDAKTSGLSVEVVEKPSADSYHFNLDP